MATLEQVENAVAELLKIGGREVVQGRIGEGAAPAKPFSMWWLSGLVLEDSIRTEIDDTEQRVIAENTPLEFTIDIVGGNAMGDAVKFGLSLRQTQRTSDLYRLCGLSGVSPFIDLSAVEVGTFRSRVQFKLSLWTMVELINEPEQIETSIIKVRSNKPPFDETYSVTLGECI